MHVALHSVHLINRARFVTTTFFYNIFYLYYLFLLFFFLFIRPPFSFHLKKNLSQSTPKTWLVKEVTELDLPDAWSKLDPQKGENGHRL